MRILLFLIAITHVYGGDFSMFIDEETEKEKEVILKISFKKEIPPFSLARMYKSGCDKQIARHCATLGVIYQTGQGEKISLKKSREYYALACKYGKKESCID